MPGAKENAEVALQEKVPVINFSLGKGDWIVERAHAYGGKVIATVVNEKHARSAEASGVDCLLVTGKYLLEDRWIGLTVFWSKVMKRLLMEVM